MVITMIDDSETHPLPTYRDSARAGFLRPTMAVVDFMLPTLPLALLHRLLLLHHHLLLLQAKLTPGPRLRRGIGFQDKGSQPIGLVGLPLDDVRGTLRVS